MYTSFYEPVKDLSDAQLGQLFRAIFANRMEEDSESHIADAAVRMAFRFIANQFSIDDAKYDEVVLSKKEAGKAGAIKRWQKMAEDSKNSKCHNAIAEDSKNALNDNVNDNDNVNVNVIKEKDKEKVAVAPSVFRKPSITEIAMYCKARNNNVDAEAFWNFYESKGWKVGNATMKDWKAAVITWEKRRKEDGNNQKYSTTEQRTMVCHDWSNEHPTL